VIEVEDWAEIRRLHRAEGLPIKQIARIKNVSRNTVRAALRSDGPPRYEREPKGSVADPCVTVSRYTTPVILATRSRAPVEALPATGAREAVVSGLPDVSPSRPGSSRAGKR
jgi:transposase